MSAAGVIVALALCAPHGAGPAPADAPAPIGRKVAASEVGAPTGLGTTAAMLLLALAVGAAVGGLARGRTRGSCTNDALEIVATESLGGRSRLVLVRARHRELLLSVNDRGAALLSDLVELDAEPGDDDDRAPSDAVRGLIALRESRRAVTAAPSASSTTTREPR